MTLTRLLGTVTSRLSTGRSPLPSLDITTASTGLLCWRDLHPQEWQLASLHPLNTDLYEAPRVKWIFRLQHSPHFLGVSTRRRSAFIGTVARVLGRASGQPPKPGGARRRRAGLTAKARAKRQWGLATLRRVISGLV